MYCILFTKEKGYSVFSNFNIKIDEFIGKYTSLEKNKKGREIKKNVWETDDLGRYCNHSSDPNSKLVYSDGEYFMYASKEISIGDEIVVNYLYLEDILGMRRNTFYREHFKEIPLKNYNVSR